MERHTQLDVARSTRREFPLVRARYFAALTVAALSLCFSIRRVDAQCGSGDPGNPDIQELYAHQRWDDVVAAAGRVPSRSADENFDFGMALAHLQRWDDARAALLAGHQQCRADKRFATELAGVAFQQKRYPEAAHWIKKALRLDPHDEYANDFAGTVFLLMGNLDATLKYWNRIQKPRIENLQTDPNLKVQRLLLERAFVFSPQSVMRREQLTATEARLDGLGIFPAYSIRLDAREGGKFDANFHAIEQNGFGNGWLQSVVSVFSGLPYETVYPSYFNLGRSATNVEALLRWDAQKRRVAVSLSGPWHFLPQWRWAIAADARDENWTIRDSFTGSAPAIGSFKLKREGASATLTSIKSGKLQWTSGAELSHRTYSSVKSGSALNPELVAPGWVIKYLAAAHARAVDEPEHRLNVDVSINSEFGKAWSSPARPFEKAQAGTVVHWFPQAEGDRYEFMQRVRGGGIAGSVPLDELWMIGVERDNDLWLRGHVGTRGGKKGSAPMADRFLLSNTDFYRSIWSNGLISVKAGPLLDVARVSAPTASLAPRQWLFDIGAEVKLTVLGTGVVLTYGRDLRNGTNAFYGSVAQH